MGLLVRSLPKKVTLFLCPISHTQNSHKMVDNVETTTPTVEEVATNGESETATEEVTAAATENGTNGVHKETTEEKTEEKNGEATTTEATNGAEAAKEATEETKEVVDEATKSGGLRIPSVQKSSCFPGSQGHKRLKTNKKNNF